MLGTLWHGNDRFASVPNYFLLMQLYKAFIFLGSSKSLITSISCSQCIAPSKQEWTLWPRDLLAHLRIIYMQSTNTMKNSPFSKCITGVKQSSSKQLKRSFPIIPDMYSLCVSKSMIKIFSFLSPLEKKLSNRTQSSDRLTSVDMSRNATERVARQKNYL